MFFEKQFGLGKLTPSTAETTPLSTIDNRANTGRIGFMIIIFKWAIVRIVTVSVIDGQWTSEPLRTT